MIDSELLSILVCPENKMPVSLADDAMIDKVNAAIAEGALKNRAGEAVTEAIDPPRPAAASFRKKVFRFSTETVIGSASHDSPSSASA